VSFGFRYASCKPIAASHTGPVLRVYQGFCECLSFLAGYQSKG
jgi:hypothetical protein